MAAIRFKMAVDKTGQVQPANLTSAQLKAIGQVMVRAQKERWSRGVNADDQTARPLHRITAKGKVTYGANPIRDMVMTGLTKENFTLRKWTATDIRAENTSREARRHARQAQRFEQMIGISPNDRDQIFGAVYRAYSAYLKRAWKPT